MQSEAPPDRWAVTEYVPPPPLSMPADPIEEPPPEPVLPSPSVDRLPIQTGPSTRPGSPASSEPPPEPVQVQEPVEPYPLPPPPRPTGMAPERRQSASEASALVIDSADGGLPLGTLIPAVLETPLDTSKPGLARAIVSQDALGRDGIRIVVPRGSRLIGEYQADARAGQNRVLVNWTRLIRPDGASIRLGAQSADSTGGAGIPGRAHSFFIARFFNAALQTALNIGGTLIGRGSSNTVIVGVPGALGASTGEGLISGDRRPKVTVKAGTLFNVFVSREVDLSENAQNQ